MSLRNRRTKVRLPQGVDRSRGAAACPLTRCMALLSGAWAPHIVWSLSVEPRRFGELRRDIAAISARVLSQRLRELEAKGIVVRTVLATKPPSVEYALTDLGRMLLPVVSAIADVGLRLAEAAPRPRTRRGNTARAHMP